MATPESIAIRRADALGRVEWALGRIAEATGAEIAPYPDPHKRAEIRPAIEAEWLADAVECIADAVAPGVVPDLSAMTRADLDAHAAELGIADPGKLKNKQEVMDAIRQAQAVADANEANGDAEETTEMSDKETPTTTTTEEPQQPTADEQATGEQVAQEFVAPEPAADGDEGE